MAEVMAVPPVAVFLHIGTRTTSYLELVRCLEQSGLLYMIAQDISHYRLIYQRWVDLINTDLQNYSKMFISTRKDILLF